MKLLAVGCNRGLAALLLLVQFFVPAAVNATVNYVSSDITTNTTWSGSDTYVVQGPITVNSGVTLTVNPGAVVKFEGIASGITVNGTLSAIGTATSSIHFTSIKDDVPGGDTNGDGNGTSPSAGNWCRMKVNSGGTMTLSYATTSYGGSYYGSLCGNEMLYNNGGVLTISNSIATSSPYYGIYQSSGTTTITNSIVSGHVYGLYLASGIAQISTSTISYNNYGVYGTGSSRLTLNGNTFKTTSGLTAGQLDISNLTLINSGNSSLGGGTNGLVITGNPNSSLTLNGDLKLPYIVNGDISIGSGIVLTLNPGTLLKFQGGSSRLTINGTLNALGSSATSTYLTSIKDDLVGGDTNGDTSSTSPSGGDWCHIKVNSGGSATFEHAVVRYGGWYNGNPCFSNMVFNDGGVVTIAASSTVSHGADAGIKTASGTTTVDNSDISFNSIGLRHSGGYSNMNGNNSIAGNSSFGIYNDVSSFTLDARNNNWGTSTGPNHYTTNTSGTGNPVSDYIDYTPWNHYDHYLRATSSVDWARNIQWSGGTNQFETEWNAAVSTWNALQKVEIEEDTLLTDADLDVSDINDSDVAWKGAWGEGIDGPDVILLNRYYLDHQTSAQVQNTITHELGHALGLGHSYLGNVMVYYQTDQTALGEQDRSDYHSMWP